MAGARPSVLRGLVDPLREPATGYLAELRRKAAIRREAPRVDAEGREAAEAWMGPATLRSAHDGPAPREVAKAVARKYARKYADPPPPPDVAAARRLAMTPLRTAPVNPGVNSDISISRRP